MNRMRVVYVAGPYRAPSAWEKEQNIRAAEELGLRVWQAGAVALVPHTMNRFYEGAADDEIWLAGARELLRRCDALILVRGWQRSKGTQIERALAIELAYPVFHDVAAEFEPENAGAFSAFEAWIRRFNEREAGK